MKNYIFLGLVAVIISTTLISCEKDDNKESINNKCNVSNPAEELEWLKDKIDNVEEDQYSYFVMANYKGETVFYYGNCDPLINYISVVMNCSGENIGYTYDLAEELTDRTILWKPENSECHFQEGYPNTNDANNVY